VQQLQAFHGSECLPDGRWNRQSGRLVHDLSESLTAALAIELDLTVVGAGAALIYVKDRCGIRFTLNYQDRASRSHGDADITRTAPQPDGPNDAAPWY
jgi:hypothetical protein